MFQCSSINLELTDNKHLFAFIILTHDQISLCMQQLNDLFEDLSRLTNKVIIFVDDALIDQTLKFFNQPHISKGLHAMKDQLYFMSSKLKTNYCCLFLPLNAIFSTNSFRAIIERQLCAFEIKFTHPLVCIVCPSNLQYLWNQNFVQDRIYLLEEFNDTEVLNIRQKVVQSYRSVL